MPDSEINFNVNKDTGGFCAGVSYSSAAFSLADCLAAYNAILSDCESLLLELTPAIILTARGLLLAPETSGDRTVAHLLRPHPTFHNSIRVRVSLTHDAHLQVAPQTSCTEDGCPSTA